MARDVVTALRLVGRPTESAPEEPPESDASLVEKARSGHTLSKERLYRRHVEYIAGMSRRMLRSVDLSEDVVQDAFVIAFTQLESLRDAEAFRPWLAAIAVSQVRRKLSRLRLLRLFGLDRGLEDASLDTLAREDATAETRLELAAIDLALRDLPPNQRIAWMLQHVEGESLEATASACGCSLATVKRWIAAADRRVQEHIRPSKEAPR
jgi:RNA polymerase sigma-70 factor (ECF subfamily)